MFLYWEGQMLRKPTNIMNWLSGSVGCARAIIGGRLRHTEDLKNGTCDLTSFVLGTNGLVRENSSRAMLPLARHHCSIHCESISCVTHGASKRKWATPLFRRTKGAQKPSINETELNWTNITNIRSMHVCWWLKAIESACSSFVF